MPSSLAQARSAMSRPARKKPPADCHQVYAAGSEDMDTLTFNSPILLRHLTFSEAKKMPISEIHLDMALKELEMDMDRVSSPTLSLFNASEGFKLTRQFIELCILLGCDYLEPCKGIGPKTALRLIREHDGLAGVVKFVRGKMAEKEQENAEARAQEEEEESEAEEEPILSDRESEEGMEQYGNGDAAPSSPKKKKKTPPPAPAKSPKKKKVTSAGMQIPEYWPWEEAKKLFLQPDVVKGDDMEVRPALAHPPKRTCR